MGKEAKSGSAEARSLGELVQKGGCDLQCEE